MSVQAVGHSLVLMDFMIRMENMLNLIRLMPGKILMLNITI